MVKFPELTRTQQLRLASLHGVGMGYRQAMELATRVTDDDLATALEDYTPPSDVVPGSSLDGKLLSWDDTAQAFTDGTDLLPADVLPDAELDGKVLGWDDNAGAFTDGTGFIPALEAPTEITQNFQTVEYTLALTDAGKLVDVTSATPVALNIPVHTAVDFPVGTRIYFRQAGAGAVTLTPADGVTLRSLAAAVVTSGQWAEGVLTVRAQDEWVASGDLTAGPS